jgi:phospholipase C
MWDEFGGWYDHVPPPYEDYDGLGMRVPLLMISPYANKGYVSHVQYEHGSILRYVEDNFGLGQLAASDSRANSPANDASFDYAQSPRPFVPFATQTKAEEFVKALPDTRPPDAQ